MCDVIAAVAVAIVVAIVVGQLSSGHWHIGHTALNKHQLRLSRNRFSRKSQIII